MANFRSDGRGAEEFRSTCEDRLLAPMHKLISGNLLTFHWHPVPQSSTLAS
jgi:hypothetical protein